MKRRLKNFFRMDSIQFTIAIACIVIAIIPMIYAGISIYANFSSMMISNSKISSTQTIDQLKLNIEEHLKRSLEATLEVQNLIEQNDLILDEHFSMSLNMYYTGKNSMYAISIFDKEGKALITAPEKTINPYYEINETHWFQKTVNQDVLFYISQPHIQNIYDDKPIWVISFCKPTTLLIDGKEEGGVIVVEMNFKTIRDLCNNLNLGGRGYVYFTDYENNLIYHPQQALYAAGLKEINNDIMDSNDIFINNRGESYLQIKKSLNYVEWNLIGVAYVNDNVGSYQKVPEIIFISIPIILFIVVCLSLYISGKISLPIMELKNHMKVIEQGNFDEKIVLAEGASEVKVLAEAFNNMVETIKKLIKQNQIEHEAKIKSDLNALQAQINPHFLYNTLDSITWMAENNQSEEVIEMVTALARLFRISISKGRSFITVAQELEHANNYMKIQKTRYKDKFEYEIIVSEEVKKLYTVKLILQPIIENAIYHGIEYMVDEGEIIVRAYVDGPNLIFEVEDNGLGIDDDTLESLNNPLKGEIRKSKGSGVGFRNVLERIKITYGEGYGINVESELEEGTKVTITLPIKEVIEDEKSR